MTEAPAPAGPPGGGLGAPAANGPMGGGPPPPMPPMGGGGMPMGGGPMGGAPPMGGPPMPGGPAPGGPAPVKQIKSLDVWSVLNNLVKTKTQNQPGQAPPNPVNSQPTNQQAFQ